MSNQSPPLVPAPGPPINQPHRRFGCGKGCLIIGGVLFALLAGFGVILERHGKAELTRANELWLEEKHAEAVEIYIRELVYVDDNDKPEVYKRIISHLHDRGDMEGATEYCNKAIKGDIEVEFARDDLRRVLADARLAIEDQEAEELAKKQAEEQQAAQVVSDRFNLKAQLNGSRLAFHLTTDLPDDTAVLVRVSRSYRERGNPSDYSVDYFSTKSTVKKLKDPTTIVVDNTKWLADLRAKNQEVSRVGLGFEVETVSQAIDIRAVVPKVTQDNLTIEHSIEIASGDLDRPPSLNPNNLDLNQTYKVSKETPLMPSHSPKDPVAALRQAKKIPSGGEFRVLEVFHKNNTPWYRVSAIDSSSKEIGRGWINSTALLGQLLSSVEKTDD